jgi:dCTP diphosphatase
MEKLTEQIRRFAQERDWEQFHNPKNLSMALSVEVAEIVEIFQWMTGQESEQLDEETLIRLEQEIGDVMIYLTNLAGRLGFDPIGAAKKKLGISAQKYPADVVRGKSRKYTEQTRSRTRITSEFGLPFLGES